MENKQQGTLVQAQARSVAKTGNQKKVQDFIRQMQPQIAKALPKVITAERFTRMMYTAISKNPELAECSLPSLMGAMMNAAQLGLEPNTPLGQAYLIPFKNKGRLEVQFVLGYKGLINLAYRSGEVVSIRAVAVREGEEFEYEEGMEPKLYHKPQLDNNRPAVAYYAVIRTKDGGQLSFVMGAGQMEEYAKRYSKAYGRGYSSPWATDFEAMAKKTVVKQALKYAPLATELIRQVDADGTIKTDLQPNMADAEDEFTFTGETVEGEQVQEPPAEDAAAVGA